MANEVAKQSEVKAAAPVGASAGTLFSQFKEHIEQSIVGKLSYELLVNAALNSIRKTPDLKKCTQSSMLAALVHCAEVGLLPDTPSQHCHLIPFWNGKKNVHEVTWLANWRGLVELARRSGEVKGIYADVVYRDDEFSYRRGLDPDLIHVPNLDSQAKTDDDITYFYAVVIYKDGWRDFEVMSKAQVDSIRARAQAKAGPAWTFFYAEQGRKTVTKRLSKRLPLSPEFAKAANLDDLGVMGESQEFDVPEIEEPKPKTEVIADKLAEKAAKVKKVKEMPTDAPEPLDTEHEEVPPEAEIEAPEPPEEATEGEREEVRPEGQEPEDFTKLLKARFSAIPTEAYTDLLKKYAPQRIKAWTPAARSQEYAALVDKINEYEAAEKTAAAKG